MHSGNRTSSFLPQKKRSNFQFDVEKRHQSKKAIRIRIIKRRAPSKTKRCFIRNLYKRQKKILRFQNCTKIVTKTPIYYAGKKILKIKRPQLGLLSLWCQYRRTYLTKVLDWGQRQRKRRNPEKTPW